jgi:hypothetical protein
LTEGLRRAKLPDVPAYVIADVEITDAERYADYSAQVPATLEAYGGRFLVRGGSTDIIEGNWLPGGLLPLRSRRRSDDDSAESFSGSLALFDQRGTLVSRRHRMAVDDALCGMQV